MLETRKRLKEIIETKTRQIHARDNLIDKLTIVSNIKKFLEENSRYWNVKDDQLIFTNTNIMVQYYDLLNELNS